MADLQVGGTFLEVIQATASQVRVGQVVLEVMRSSAGNRLRVAQVVLEVMRTPVAVPAAAIRQSAVTVISS